jgi:hypothetical protein
VDKVEVVWGICPFGARVVDFESKVRRRGGVEDGGEVGGGDFGGGEVVCDVDGPESGAGADVEDAFGVSDGCEEEFVVQREEPEVVDNCFVGLVLFVVGGVVGAVAVGVVTTSVFVAVAGYLGGERATAR